MSIIEYIRGLFRNFRSRITGVSYAEHSTPDEILGIPEEELDKIADLVYETYRRKK